MWHVICPPLLYASQYQISNFTKDGKIVPGQNDTLFPGCAAGIRAFSRCLYEVGVYDTKRYYTSEIFYSILILYTFHSIKNQILLKWNYRTYVQTIFIQSDLSYHVSSLTSRYDTERKWRMITLWCRFVLYCIKRRKTTLPVKYKVDSLKYFACRHVGHRAVSLHLFQLIQAPFHLFQSLNSKSS